MVVVLTIHLLWWSVLTIHLLWWSVLTFICYGGPFSFICYGGPVLMVVHSFVMVVRFNNLFVIGGPF